MKPTQLSETMHDYLINNFGYDFDKDEFNNVSKYHAKDEKIIDRNDYVW